MISARQQPDEIRWTPRVSKRQIRRLYEADAQGMVDEALLDEVGTTLFARCQDILTVKEARLGRVQCPRCAAQRRQSTIVRACAGHGADDEVLVCTQCGWQMTWGGYRQSFKHKQLHSGGATEWFERYVRSYPHARTAREKMLAIDELIHAFHCSLRQQPDLPTRPVCVNLIAGKVTDVVQFLDELSYGEGTRPEMRQKREEWRRGVGQTVWRETIRKDDSG